MDPATSTAPTSPTSPTVPASPATDPIRPAPGAVAQHAINNHLTEITSLMHPPTFVDNTSVLAVVKFPADDQPNMACDGNRWQDLTLRMNHQKLVNLGSSKINAMLEPRYQARILRRLGLTGLPPGIEYILDFTPPAEGAELADLTAALWLPRMAKLWFLAGHYIPDPIIEQSPDSWSSETRRLAEKAVGACLALGHDDVCRHGFCLVDSAQWEINKDIPGIFEDDSLVGEDGKRASFIPPFRKIEDYCPIRHRVAIMRVLRAINGDGMLLNSAARMWTVARTAIHMEAPQVVVDFVTQWLIAPPNTKFLEICPEKAFQLALDLKIPSVLITTFKILVSELAVDLAAPVPSPIRPPRSWTQRKRDDYGDFPSDPVDYAARAFVERMTGHLEMLRSDTVFDRLDPPIIEWKWLKGLGRKIDHSTSISLGISYDLLVESLITVQHRRVTHALQDPISPYRLVQAVEAQRRHYLSKTERAPLEVVYHSLSPSQKALTPFFWRSLGVHRDFHSWEYAFNKGQSLLSIASEFNKLLMEEISKGHIQTSCETFNLGVFYHQLKKAITALCDSFLYREREDPIQLVLSDHLLSNLNEAELNYLPIWANGLDDGSGGVFQDIIPPAEMGPSEPGPAYHTGYTVATDTTTTLGGGPSTIAPSDLGMGNLEIEGTVARSMDAEQSITTGPARNLVVAAGSSIHNSSDRFSAVNDAEYADAMYAQPAAHQAHGKALARYVEEDGEGADNASSVFTFGDSVTESHDGTVDHDENENENRAAGNADLNMMDMEPEGELELDLSDEDSTSTLGGSDYDMI